MRNKTENKGAGKIISARAIHNEFYNTAEVLRELQPAPKKKDSKSKTKP